MSWVEKNLKINSRRGGGGTIIWDSRVNGKQLYPTKSVKYLGIKNGENLTWIDHINNIAIKLNRANAILFKVREFVNIKILKLIYYTIFDCHLNYVNTVWGQNRNSMNRIKIPQKQKKLFALCVLNVEMLIQIIFFQM